MKKKEEFLIRTIGGEQVMMAVGSTALKFNGLIYANDVSAFIWNNIEQVNDSKEMAKMICDEFDVSYEEAFADADEFIQQMIKAGWIEKGNES